LKPEFITFNVEVFHALFVATCMQAAASFHTTMVLLGMDFVFGVLSLRRILKMIRKFYATVHRPLNSESVTEQELTEATKHATQWKQMHFLDAAIYILGTNPNVLNNHDLTIYSQVAIRSFGHILPAESIPPTSTKSSLGRHDGNSTKGPSRTTPAMSAGGQTRAGSTSTSVSKIPAQLPLRSMRSKLAKQIRHLSEEDKRLVLMLDETNRLLFVQHVLGMLFWAEFILLVEFTEVIIPMVYCKSACAWILLVSVQSFEANTLRSG
jgi:hypothetical protein